MYGYELTRKDGVARITFNRPHLRNAVDPTMMIAIDADLRAIARDETVRCVVIAGEGGCFSSGADLGYFKEIMALSDADRVAKLTSETMAAHHWMETLEAMPQPVIASVRGAVGGSGMAFVMSADLVIASEDSFFTVAHVKIGGSPDGGATYYLPRLLGSRQAKRLCLLGDRFDARKAYDLGLVTDLVPDAELETATEALAQRICASAGLALAGAKALINASFDNDLATQLKAEVESFGRGAATHDFKEGVSAFLDKRAPAFQGR